MVMAVIAFVRPEPALMAAPAQSCPAQSKLRLYGRTLSACFLALLALWLAEQIGCLLSLFLHFHAGIVAGTINGTLAFKFWPALDDFSPTHALSNAFVPHIFPAPVAIAYALILLVASVPFCAALWYLARLFTFYAHGEIFTPRTEAVMRRIGHAVLATGYSPFLLGPFAHAIGVLKPVTGVTSAMIACVILGLILLAMSHVMAIGQRLQQDQEGFL
jgi:uncharacterized membrane protein